MFLKVRNPLKCFLVVLVSFGCWNKLPQTRGPNIPETYSLLVVVARCPKSRAMLPPEALEENLPSPLPALGGRWRPLGYGHISLCLICLHIIFSSVYLISLCLSRISTLLLLFQAY